MNMPVMPEETPNQPVLLRRQELDAIVAKAIISAMTTISDEINVRMDSKYTELSDRLDGNDVEHFDIYNRLDTAEARIVKLEGALTESENRGKKLETQYCTAMAYANENEQYSRKSSLRVYGMNVEAHEDCARRVAELLNPILHLNLQPADIDSAHRIGRPYNNKPPPILVKFTHRGHKIAVIKNRQAIKAATGGVAGIRVADDVTKLNMKLMHRLNDHEDIEAAWFYNGKVFARVHGREGRVRVQPFDDINKICRTAAQRQPLLQRQTTPPHQTRDDTAKQERDTPQQEEDAQSLHENDGDAVQQQVIVVDDAAQQQQAAAQQHENDDDAEVNAADATQLQQAAAQQQQHGDGRDAVQQNDAAQQRQQAAKQTLQPHIMTTPQQIRPAPVQKPSTSAQGTPPSTLTAWLRFAQPKPGPKPQRIPPAARSKTYKAHKK